MMTNIKTKFYNGIYYKVDWYFFSRNLSENENAIKIFDKYPEIINWGGLCKNKNAMKFINKQWEEEQKKENEEKKEEKKKEEKKEDEKKKIDWKDLTYNENASYLLKKHFDKLEKLEKQKLEKNHTKKNTNTPEFLHEIYWEGLIRNKSKFAMDFCEKHFKMLDEFELETISKNDSKYAIRFLEKHPNEINWDALSSNKSAIHMIEKKIKQKKKKKD